MDTLNFNESGKYIETIPADGDHVGSVAGKDGYNFKFADERWTKEFTTDEFPTSIEMGGDGGKYNSVYLAPKKIIDKTLEASGVKDFWKKTPIIKHIYAYKESRGIGKKMDYVNSKTTQQMAKENPYSLFVTDSRGLKVAHNLFNYGNFLWGAGMSSLTIPYSHAVVGAHVDNLFNNGFELDSKDDQISIFSGYLYK